jgi:hypothetical protein
MYIVYQYTENKGTVGVTVPIVKREAEKLAGLMNEQHQNSGIDFRLQHFFIMRVN